jgi:hypothetical protein
MQVKKDAELAEIEKVAAAFPVLRLASDLDSATGRPAADPKTIAEPDSMT